MASTVLGQLPEGRFTSVHTEHHKPVGFTDADARSIEESCIRLFYHEMLPAITAE